MWTRSKEALLSLIFPPLCESCRNPLSFRRSSGVCEACEASVGLMEPPFCPGCGRTAGESCGACNGQAFHHDRAHVAARYEGRLKDWLAALKFHGRRPLSKTLERLVENHIERWLDPCRFDAVAAVPLDPGTRKERGFNQSELLSKAAAKKLRVPDVSSALGRVRSAIPQHRLDKKNRAINVRDRFFVKNPSAVSGKRLLLVDDVLTTGLTVSECARVLKSAGAARVEALAAAGGLKT